MLIICCSGWFVVFSYICWRVFTLNYCILYLMYFIILSCHTYNKKVIENFNKWVIGPP